MFEHVLQVISQWLMDQPPLGHKAPRPGMGRLVVCPACPAFFPTPSPMSSRHTYDNTFSINYGIPQACASGLLGCGDCETERGNQKIPWRVPLRWSELCIIFSPLHCWIGSEGKRDWCQGSPVPRWMPSEAYWSLAWYLGAERVKTFETCPVPWEHLLLPHNLHVQVYHMCSLADSDCLDCGIWLPLTSNIVNIFNILLQYKPIEYCRSGCLFLKLAVAIVSIPYCTARSGWVFATVERSIGWNHSTGTQSLAAAPEGQIMLLCSNEP